MSSYVKKEVVQVFKNPRNKKMKIKILIKIIGLKIQSQVKI